MISCKVCGKNRSEFVMNNRLVCLSCDELLFDIEIECEDGNDKHTQPTTRVLDLNKTQEPTKR